MKRITLIILAVASILFGSISCQKANDIDNNPLSEVAISIIPDFSDGSVYSCSDEGSFFLRVSVKPEKYIEKLSDNDAFICKADFRSVITKANAENPNFTVVGEITSSFVEEGYMTVYFELSEDEVAKIQESDYVVSFSIEDKDNTHVASTSYVPMDIPRGGQGGEEITLIQPDKPLPGVFTVADPDGVPDSGDETKVQFSQGNLASNADYGYWGIFENQYDCLETPSYEYIVCLYSYGISDPGGIAGTGRVKSDNFNEYDLGPIVFPGQGWRTLSAQEWCYLFGLVLDEAFMCLGEMDETNPRSNLFRIGVEVMGRNCVVLYPDNYQGTKKETFDTESDYAKATAAGIVFLPLAGFGNVGSDPDYVGEIGSYWSTTGACQDRAVQISFYSYYREILMGPENYRSCLAIRLVKDYASEK